MSKLNIYFDSPSEEQGNSKLYISLSILLNISYWNYLLQCTKISWQKKKNQSFLLTIKKIHFFGFIKKIALGKNSVLVNKRCVREGRFNFLGFIRNLVMENRRYLVRSLNVLLLNITCFAGKVFKVWTSFQQKLVFPSPLWIQVTHRMGSKIEWTC